MAVGCRAEQLVPESGAVLIRVVSTAAAATPSDQRPDELRVSAYDDSGILWDRVRIPETGKLAAASGGSFGTLLIQPGMIRGALRVHIRAFASGARVLDGIASIAAARRDQGAIDLFLDPAIPPDADADDVPDSIDDCPGAPNPPQGGCPPTPDGGTDGTRDSNPDETIDDASVETDASVDTNGADTVNDASVETSDGPADATTICDGESGGCPRPIGTACAANGECASGACADGVCCASACVGPCRSCNQPTATGTCQGYIQGADPERECTAGGTCNGAGACGPAVPPDKTNGQACARANQCLSGFCTDGVCCNSACGDPCQSCTTGACQAVKRGDDVPECTGAMTCNMKGTCVPS